MTAHGLRWLLVAMLVGVWVASIAGVMPLGPMAHGLVVLAAALAFYQRRNRPTSTAFELWQEKQRRPQVKVAPRRIWGGR